MGKAGAGLFLLCAAVMGLSAAPASGADLLGPWSVSGDFGRSLRYTLECVFNGDDKSFSGPCAARTGKPLPTSGRRAGDRVEFSYLTDYNGSGLKLNFAGLEGPDKSIEGAVTANASKGVFKAQPVYTDQTGGVVTYKVSVAFSDDLRYVDLCTFKTSGGRISGPCSVTDGSSLQVSGSVDGSAVSFGYDTEFAGKPVHLDYKGVLSGGTIKGGVKAGDQDGAFTAQKQ